MAIDPVAASRALSAAGATPSATPAAGFQDLLTRLQQAAAQGEPVSADDTRALLAQAELALQTTGTQPAGAGNLDAGSLLSTRFGPLAGLLGLPTDQLLQRLQAGDTPQGLAQAAGIGPDQLQAALEQGQRQSSSLTTQNLLAITQRSLMDMVTEDPTDVSAPDQA